MKASESPDRADERVRTDRVARWTTISETARSLTGDPATGFEAWARTTAGLVLLLFALQLTTGVLLAFYYVPSAGSAHTTVAFIEKQVAAGQWVRAMHSHGSQWLTVALVLHLAQMLFVGEGWRRRPVGWVASITLLALALAGGATGYSLPWDARAFYATRVAAGVTGGLPLVGGAARAWLVGGADLSTLTVSRFYALHVFLIPALVLTVAVARVFVFRERASGMATHEDRPRRRGWVREQLARHAVAAGAVFVALALYSLKFPAPLGPPAEEAAAGYLPRPGAQFLWLFQTLKYLPGTLASLVAVAFPIVLLGGLALLPLLGARKTTSRLVSHPRRNVGALLFASGLGFVTIMTALAYVEDARNPRVRGHLSRQARDEEAFRRTPFEPRPARTGAGEDPAASGALKSDSTLGQRQTTSTTGSAAEPPAAYAQHCAKCHGARGEGRSINPRLIGVAARPRRSLEDIIAILNDPASYGLEKRMPSFASKLSEEEKRAVAAWVVSLK
ncbi:MAG: cytochrome b N-terminal domain-containing protein, partial [Pyrinomonadaceae bacterium]